MWEIIKNVKRAIEKVLAGRFQPAALTLATPVLVYIRLTKLCLDLVNEKHEATQSYIRPVCVT